MQHFFTISLLALSILSLVFTEQTSDELPGMQITNWHDSVLRFRANRGVYSDASSQIPGPYQYRISSDYAIDSITSDSFALAVDGTYYNEPTNWETLSGLNQTGVYTTSIQSYDNTTIEDLSLTLEYEFAPYYPFYLVRYNITNTGSSTISGYLMDAIGLSDYNSTGPSTTFSSDSTYGPYSQVDLTGSSTFTFGHGVQAADSGFELSSATYHAGGSSSSAYDLFKSNSGVLDNTTSCTETNQTLGISVAFSVDAGSTNSITFYRTFRATTTAFNKSVKLARAKTFAQVLKAGTREYSAFLRRGKQLKTAPKLHKTFFNNSLLFMKNAINPTTGAITSNFHPDLIDQVRPDDGCLIALALAEAGYRSEAADYFDWLAKRDLVTVTNLSKPVFASAYNFYDSSVDTSVTDPHLDTLGLFMMGCYYLYIHTDLRDRLRTKEDIITSITDALQMEGYNELFPADIHPYELSGTTCTYNAWTQAFAYSGLMMAAKLQRFWYCNLTYSEILRRRGLDLHASVKKFFFNTTASDEEDGILISSFLTPAYTDGSESEPTANSTADATTFAFFFLGLLGAPSSSSTYIQIPPIKSSFARSHHNGLLAKLIPSSEDTSSAYTRIGRYESDTEYSEEFNSTEEPAWPSATIYAIWAEHALGTRANHALRLNWLAQVSSGTSDATHNQQPAGKAVDYSTHALSWQDAPDILGHSALYVWTYLMTERNACMINPLSWAHDGVL